MRSPIHRSLLRCASTLLLSGTLLASLSAGTASADIPFGCQMASPDAHLVAGRKVDVDYLFTCDNAFIGYVKMTLALRRDRPHWRDPVLESHQFDNFRNPSHARASASLQTDGPCHPGHKYHGDITITVIYNNSQSDSYSVRGRSVSCS